MTHRPAGHGKPIQACDQSTTRLQNQFGQDRNLGKRGSAQVTVAMVLSGVSARYRSRLL